MDDTPTVDSGIPLVSAAGRRILVAIEWDNAFTSVIYTDPIEEC